MHGCNVCVLKNKYNLYYVLKITNIKQKKMLIGTLGLENNILQ